MSVLFERKEDRIRFSDTSGITHDQFVKIMYRFQYLGYTDLTEPDHIKEYFDRHCFLNEDQSLAVLDILGEQTQTAEDLSDEDANRLISAAVDVFGTTSYFGKAGYLLPDGRLLDFSEGQYQRTLDHRSIHDIFPDEDDATDCMLRFMSCGCARVSAHNIDMIRPLTDKQRSRLSSYAGKLRTMSDNSFYMDITNPHGNTIRSESYEINILSDMHKLIDDADKYFTLFTT